MDPGAGPGRGWNLWAMGARVSMPVVAQDAALRRVLARHHLMKRTGAAGIVQVADDVVGLHATSPTTPYLSLHERILGFGFADLEDAVYERRDLVRLKAMRGTVFLLSRRLAPLVFAATRAATLASDRRWLGTNDEAYQRVAPKVLAALAGKSFTVAELRKTLGADADLAGVVAMLCDEGRIVRDRPLGSRSSSIFRYRPWGDAFPEVSLDEWDETAATRELVRLYLDGYGPVSRADLIWWTGQPARRIDDALRDLGEELVTVSVAGLGDGLLMTPSALDQTTAIEPRAVAVNLLPMIDPYTMGCKDRGRLLDPALNETVVDRGGNVTSVVVVDGRVAGVWDLTEEPNAAVRVLLFDPGHRDRRRILDRAAETAAFWFGDPVPVQEYTSMVPLQQRSGVMRRPLDDAQPRTMAPRAKAYKRPRTSTTAISRSALRRPRPETRGGTP